MKTIGIATCVLLLLACSPDALLEAPPNSEPTFPMGEESCEVGEDCAPGEMCNDGVCVELPGGDPTSGGDPSAGDPGPTPTTPVTVHGPWATDYLLDLSGYLGPLAGLGDVLTQIEAVLLGQSGIAGLPIPEFILQMLVDELVPDWMTGLVVALNSVVQAFEAVHIDGHMVLVHAAGTAPVTGNESWDLAVVCSINACPANGAAIECSDVDLGTGARIGASPQPFAGSFDGAEVSFPDRRVDIQLSRLVRHIVDLMTYAATCGEYATLDHALEAIIDCTGFTVAIEDFMCGNLGVCDPMTMVETACVAARFTVMDEIHDRLDAITVDWETLAFDQAAGVIDDPEDGWADRLHPGSLTNGTFMVLPGSFDGTWEGNR